MVINQKYRAILYLVFLTFHIIILSGCGLLPKEEKPLEAPLVKPKKIEYELYKVTAKDLSKTLKGMGTFFSNQEAALYFGGNGGVLKSIEVKLGQKVTSGSVLAKLETGNLVSRIRLKQNDIKRLETQLEYLKSVYEKNMSLPLDSRIPGNEIEEMQKNIKLQEIELDSARIEYEDLETESKKSDLISPINGIVTFIEDIKAGDMIQPFKRILIVAEPKNMQIYYQSDQVKEVRAGMRANVVYKGREYEGKVVLAPDNVPVDALDKFQNAIVIDANNLPDDLEWGDTADFTVDIQKKKNVLSIPQKGLKRYMGRTYVQVLEGDIKKEYDVETGVVTPFEVEIISGIKEGQMVILN